MSNHLNQNIFRLIVGTAGMLTCTTVCLFVATAAGAEPVDSPARTRTVSFSDLDLSTSQGRLVLDRRLKRAAGQVCALDIGSTYGGYARQRRCVRDTLEAALPSVVSALYPVD